MTKIIVTNYELTADYIYAQLSDGKNDCEYRLDRTEYEDWLTDGTGMIDMGFTHHNGNVLTEVEIKEPIADYWLQGEEINNSPVLEHLQLYVTRDELSRSLARAALLEQYLKDLLEQLEPVQRADGQTTLLEYGLMCKEAGEQGASALFKRIITSRSL